MSLFSVFALAPASFVLGSAACACLVGRFLCFAACVLALRAVLFCSSWGWRGPPSFFVSLLGWGRRLGLLFAAWLG
ncbi:hypothetical protein [Kibdelosporangium philippinense]|uniref:hypothetical protein n=1 Tax=Kibdelosporangium philippinense TaxID=211113 RepID=UPI00361C384C